MIAFDWQRVWEGDSKSITLTNKQRAFLASIARNAVDNPSDYIVNYDESESEDVTDFLDNLLFRLTDTMIVQPENGLQSIITIWAEDAIRGINDAGATPTVVLNANSWYGHYFAQQPPVLNDQVHNNLWLSPGDYSIRHYCNTQSSAGRLTIYIWKMFGDGAILTPLNASELYTASFVNNVIKTGDFTITEGGEYKIVWGIASKHASSSGYRHEWYKTVILRKGVL